MFSIGGQCIFENTEGQQYLIKNYYLRDVILNNQVERVVEFYAFDNGLETKYQNIMLTA